MAISTITNNSVDAAAAIATSKLGTGAVLQVVNATISTNSSTTSTSFVATNLTATITPKFSNSKILVLVNGVGWCGLTAYAYYTIARGTTVLSGGSSGLAAIYNNDGATPISMSFLDSPATTSPVSYSAYFKRGATGTAYFIEATNGTGVITLMEIAA